MSILTQIFIYFPWKLIKTCSTETKETLVVTPHTNQALSLPRKRGCDSVTTKNRLPGEFLLRNHPHTTPYGNNGFLVVIKTMKTPVVTSLVHEALSQP